MNYRLPYSLLACVGILGVSNAQGTELIENGDFSAGNVGFSSEYCYQCGILGAYYIVTDASTLSQWWTGGDHTTGSGLFMVVDGAYDAQRVVWSKSLCVVPNSNYEVSFWFRKVDWPTNDIARLQIKVNGVPLGSTITVSSGSWMQSSQTWNSGGSALALIEIRDLLPTTMGNGGDDFGLDDFSFIGPSPPGDPYCFSDGCPCGNDVLGAGCENSTGTGALLSACGTASVAADDLILTVSNVPPNQFGILFMGGGQISPMPFGDGLLCVSPGPASFCRFPVQNSGPGGTITEGPGIVAFSLTLQPLCHIIAGNTWNFQGWYRDPQGPCGGGFNLSNAVAVTFGP